LQIITDKKSDAAQHDSSGTEFD